MASDRAVYTDNDKHNHTLLLIKFCVFLRSLTPSLNKCDPLLIYLLVWSAKIHTAHVALL